MPPPRGQQPSGRGTRLRVRARRGGRSRGCPGGAAKRSAAGGQLGARPAPMRGAPGLPRHRPQRSVGAADAPPRPRCLHVCSALLSPLRVSGKAEAQPPRRRSSSRNSAEKTPSPFPERNVTPAEAPRAGAARRQRRPATPHGGTAAVGLSAPRSRGGRALGGTARNRTPPVTGARRSASTPFPPTGHGYWSAILTAPAV